MDLIMKRQEIQKEWKDDGQEVDVYFHNSSRNGLHEGNFVFRGDSKKAPTSLTEKKNKKGMFTHTGKAHESSYFKANYGHVIYAVIVDIKLLPPVRPVDSANKEKKEAFIDRDDVLQIVEL